MLRLMYWYNHNFSPELLNVPMLMQDQLTGYIIDQPKYVSDSDKTRRIVFRRALFNLGKKCHASYAYSTVNHERTEII